MSILKKHAILLCGICAGAVNGLLGAGGGMVLVPLLDSLSPLEEREIFPASVAIILPICAVSLLFSPWSSAPALTDMLPYLLGSALGGVLCGLAGKRIPVFWLHRFLGGLILWGGLQKLC